MYGFRCACLLLCLVCLGSLRAQHSPVKWGKASIHYTEQAKQTNQTTPSGGALSAVIWLYHVGFSEADGDHCPFAPTCSHFLLTAVHETNFLQGLCMFMDRFTRDSNPVNRDGNYHFNMAAGRYEDPVSRYILK